MVFSAGVLTVWPAFVVRTLAGIVLVCGSARRAGVGGADGAAARPALGPRSSRFAVAIGDFSEDTAMPDGDVDLGLRVA